MTAGSTGSFLEKPLPLKYRHHICDKLPGVVFIEKGADGVWRQIYNDPAGMALSAGDFVIERGFKECPYCHRRLDLWVS